ncbi:uncharacterized protein LOC132753158 [Ruditapes philippinarum]|uniref:uncharacterized protein LOC132753158 n=1 Tax=Ruditapes philippinarum TaxID=129788 RepID=UPI00295B6DCB|nr:uncharacterized protein LOC132753158 [Ruditapes philippinarum]
MRKVVKILSLILGIIFILCGHNINATNYCPFGQQEPGLFCGRGPTSQPCPTGTYCEISPVDAYAVCCPVYCTNGLPKYKGNKSSKGIVTCDKNEKKCGSKYMCETIPNYDEKVCCPRESN